MYCVYLQKHGDVDVYEFAHTAVVVVVVLRTAKYGTSVHT